MGSSSKKTSTSSLKGTTLSASDYSNILAKQYEYAGEYAAAEVEAEADALIKLTEASNQIKLRYAEPFAQKSLDIQQKYGTDYTRQQMDELEVADPESLEVRGKYADLVSGELDNAYSLSPEMTRELENQIRGAQTARGNWLGSAPTAQEAMNKGSTMWNMYQTRLGNAQSFLTSPTPQSYFGALNAAQSTENAQYYPATVQGSGNYYNAPSSMNYGQLWATSSGNALSAYSTAAGENASLANNSNPWMSALGTVTGGLVGGISGGIGSGLAKSWFN